MCSMLLIYSHISTSRLLYICLFIFKEQLGIDFKFTIDSEKFRVHEGPKINYSNTRITVGEFFIQNHSLLFEQGIRKQQVECFIANNKAFFKTAGSDFSFDILSAAFYLISRYEEYLPHEKDLYGRYAHENSLAYNEGFLHLPLINSWIKELSKSLKLKFPTLRLQPPNFKFIPTYDIDMAWSYKNKGLLRNIGGFLKKPSLERIKVLTGLLKDPFDAYDWLHEQQQGDNLTPIYFFLVAEKNGRFDKNILPHKDAMWKLVKYHAKKYEVGLHPSWQSGDNKSLLITENEQLSAMCNVSETTISRQHYIRFNLPQGYKQLIDVGITDDYSMGYGSINGFRASVASPFYWYNLAQEVQTTLRIHPFCFMDANSFYEQKQTPEQTFDELLGYLSVCKENNCTLISIWHNNFLGNAKRLNGWKKVYEKFISLAQQ